jgi:hypothetical protein
LPICYTCKRSQFSDDEAIQGLKTTWGAIIEIEGLNNDEHLKNFVKGSSSRLIRLPVSLLP